jgi:hypothetical protein
MSVNQELVMTRTSFLVSLEVQNEGNFVHNKDMFHIRPIGDTTWTNIAITLSIIDEFGVESEEKFEIGEPELTFISSLDSGRTLPGKTSGQAEVDFEITSINVMIVCSGYWFQK